MQKTKISKIILGTGNYQNVKSGNTVSITGDGGNAWGYYGPSYKKLAPRLNTYTEYAKGYEKLQELKKESRLDEYLKLRKEIENQYIKEYYETRLKDLNIMELLIYFKEKYGEKIIFLCHEEIEEFCHRRVFADYIELETGIYVPEVSVDEVGKVKKIMPIRYKNRLKEIIK